MQCVIGISVALDDRERWRAGREYHYLDASYARAIEQSGAIPLYLPVQDDAKGAVDQLDGLLIPGGDDLLPPAPYSAGVEFDAVPAAQLEFDRGLLRAALGSGLPVLGICYGMQLLALEHGGTLHYDIGTDLPDAEQHQLDESLGRHAISVEPGSLLERVAGLAADPVNSKHHQAVADPGDGLRVCARAPDGVVEAVEATRGRFCLGVQWHPERLHGAQSRALFDAFVAACREPGPP